METENTLTTAEESLNELFFEEEARLWAEVYGKQSDKPDHIFRIVIGNIHQISELTFSCFLVCYQTGHLNIYTLSLFYSDKINFLLFMLPYINVILQI